MVRLKTVHLKPVAVIAAGPMTKIALRIRDRAHWDNNLHLKTALMIIVDGLSIIQSYNDHAVKIGFHV